MKVSARNVLSGKVKDMVKGQVSTEVTITAAGSVDIVAVIRTRSAESLGLAVGKTAHALINASSVMVAID